ncbi:phage tail protein I [Serratia fonticola]|uniref:phage tail protein I n=1 Tax=Serratia fonticola TaxID=47917 RepID=UPI001378DE5A|nr:phage tail protein I [Serratia fonticola]NCG53726.1 phage tail protein I [Serratia fonticola]
MSSLLPASASTLERLTATACADATDLAVPLRDLWNPDKCPVKFLPYLAWAFSVDQWDDKWSEKEKRNIISEAFRFHQRKGTTAAVRQVIEGMGYSMSLSEWWQVNDPAGTFRLEIDVNEVGLSDKSLDELNRLINETKPVSRHVSQLTISTHVTGYIFAGSALYSGEIITIYPENYEQDESILYNGMIFHDGNNSYR